MRLRDRVALVTGAGSGFGRATSELFAREGARIVVVDVDGATGEDVAAGIRARGGEAVFVRADVTQSADAAAMVRAATESFGRLDVLFNNAGIPMAPTPTEDVDETLWEHLFAVNVKGVWLGCKHAIPVMKKQGSGVIINTASTAGVRPRPGAVAYATTKGAVITFTRGLALELAPFKIRVCSISPVAGDTPMFPGFLPPGADVEEGRRRFIATVPLGRLSRPDDIAQAALYLASDEASIVTGTNLEVDGGRDL